MARLIEGDFLAHKDELVKAIRSGKILIYPTDTIYGLGCDANNLESVEKIRKLKHQDQHPLMPYQPKLKKPFLVAVPSLEWIHANCVVGESARKQIEEKLPGRYSFILKLRNRNIVAPGVGLRGSLGVRFLNHPFQKIITEAGVPFISTSVNISGEPFSENLQQIPEAIKRGVDYIIYQGPIAGPPSTRVNLTN